MQDQKTEITKKAKWSDRFWAGAALFILVLGAAFFGYIFYQLPHAEWRNDFKPLSWKANGVCIKKAEVFWKLSAGDARMEMRSYNHPVCRIHLDEAKGSGVIAVRFLNGNQVQMGDRVYLEYRDGKFVHTESENANVTEKEAEVRLEDGFLTRDDYVLHQMDEQAPYWRVEVDCSPDNKTFYRLGHLSIIPHDL